MDTAQDLRGFIAADNSVLIRQQPQQH